MNMAVKHMPRVLALLIFPAMAALLAGCGSAVDPGAFQQFTESTVELRESADEVLGHQYEWTRERFFEETAAGDSISQENLQKLMLDIDPDRPFALASPEHPLLFLEAKQFKETVRELNDALVQYAELLSELAVAGRMSGEEFKGIAEGINEGVRDATAVLSDKDRNQDIAIFSTVATELFQQYLKSSNREMLRDALDENQENIQVFSDHLRDAMLLAWDHAFNEYAFRRDDLAWELGSEGELKQAEKMERLQDLIDLNELLIKRMDTFRRLDDSYRALPGANRELAGSLDKAEGGLASIYRIRDNALRLRDVYRDLEQPADEQNSNSEPEPNEE